MSEIIQFLYAIGFVAVAFLVVVHILAAWGEWRDWKRPPEQGDPVGSLPAARREDVRLSTGLEDEDEHE
jgi:hypothetical protein